MIKKAITISTLVLLLVLVRVFQYDIFYDPFLYYFKGDYLTAEALPEFSWLKMTLSLLLRYTINTSISLAIIYVLFKDLGLIKFSIILYIIMFVVLITLYYYYINVNFENGYLGAFYARRFIIQPLLVFLLVPAFFYQNKKQ